MKVIKYLKVSFEPVGPFKYELNDIGDRFTDEESKLTS